MQATATDVPSTPAEATETQIGPDDEDDGENDDQEVEDNAASPVKEEPPDEAPATAPITNGVKILSTDDSNDAAARFDALVKDRDALRQEVTQLRQSLQELQSKHAGEIEVVQTELADTQAEERDCGRAIPISAGEGEHYTVTAWREIKGRCCEISPRCASKSMDSLTLLR